MMEKSVKKIIVEILFFLLNIIFVSSLCSLDCTAKQTKKTVRVGYIQMQGFLYEEDGSYSGLAYDLLQEIASYNNWNYEFYECGYSEVKDLFDAGKIDIFVPYQKTSERASEYEYSNEVFCTNKASLLTLPESSIDYNDYKDLDGCTIGTLKGTRNGKRFQEYFEKNNCHVTIKSTYIRRQELLDAVKSGEIDAFVSASNRGITDFKIVGQLPQTDSYVIAPKGNHTYLDIIDDAIGKMNIETPFLIHELEKKYQSTTQGRYPSLSEEEIDFIAQKKEVSVLISPEECDADGNFSESSKVLFEHITSLTGLTFVPVIANSTSEIMEGITKGKADIVYSFNHDFDWAKLHQVWLTSSYSTFYNKLITKIGKTKIKTVAIVPNSFLAYWIKKNTDYQTIEYDSYEECINAVLRDKVDGVYCNTPIANYYSTFPKYSRLSFLTAFDMESSYCIAVSQSSEQILVDILNKAVLCIPESTLNSVYEIQMNSRPLSIIDVFYSNPIVCIAVILLIMIVVLTMIFIVFYLQRIRKKNEQLAIANSAKTDFMSRMSHDMRTPMNGILGLTQLCIEEDNLETIHNNLSQIELSGRVLLALINDTLDMNKIESGKLKLHMQPINSEEVFSNVLTNANIMAADKGIQLELHLPNIAHGKWTPVMADPSRLEQVLFNIISNAIKFTPTGGTVKLIMETVSIGDGLVKDRYIISDNGIGMSKEFLPHLFDAFSQEKRQVKENQTKDQGTGLGMSIVKQLITLMQGDIQVKSELGKGTEVTLLMQYPIYDGSVEGKKKESVDFSVLRGKRVLLCEDHPINAQIASRLLKKMQVEVDLAENGEKGLKKFSESIDGHYDCILMDIRMPVMNGLETTTAIRQLPRKDAKIVPIIAMTANAFDEDIQNCFSVGMNDHLAKPFEVNQLYQIIAKYL